MRLSVRALALSLFVLGSSAFAASAQTAGVVSRTLPRPEGRTAPLVPPEPSERSAVAADRIAAAARPDVVRILAQFGNTVRLCTGVMIAPRIALTSGRCVHQGAGGEFALDYWVAPGHDGSTAPYGQAFGSLLYTFSEWTERSDPAFDLGFVVLDRALGDASGWVDLSRADGCGSYLGAEFTWAGYFDFTLGQANETGAVSNCTDARLSVGSPVPFSSGLPLLSADRRVHGASSTAANGTIGFTRINARVMDFYTEYLIRSLDPCDGRVEAERSEFGSEGGEAQIAVTTGQGCSWSVEGTLPSWVEVLQSNGVSFGRPVVRVAANPGPAREATIVIATRQVTIAQAAAGTAPNVRYAAAARPGGSIVHTGLSTSGGGRDPEAPAPAGATGTGAWWRWTAPTSAFTTIAVSSNFFGTALGVYTGSGPSALTIVGEGRESVSFTASAGVSYLIYGASVSPAEGSMQLRIEQLFAGAEAQTGWWWNPDEPGRGVFLETNGIYAFLGWFGYNDGGSNSWQVARGEILTRRFFRTPLSSFQGGSSLGGPYRAPAFVGNSEPISVAFPTATQATLSNSTTTVPLQRFSFVGSGPAADRAPFAPETGWWWTPSEPGVGYAIEVQGNALMLGIAHFDAAGAARWSIVVGGMTTPYTFEANAASFEGGQALGQSYRPPTGSSDTGRVSIVFQDSKHATIQLPGGRSVSIERFQF
jgi:hypothetical protein